MTQHQREATRADCRPQARERWSVVTCELVGHRVHVRVHTRHVLAHKHTCTCLYAPHTHSTRIHAHIGAHTYTYALPHTHTHSGHIYICTYTFSRVPSHTHPQTRTRMHANPSACTQMHTCSHRQSALHVRGFRIVDCRSIVFMKKKKIPDVFKKQNLDSPCAEQSPNPRGCVVCGQARLWPTRKRGPCADPTPGCVRARASLASVSAGVLGRTCAAAGGGAARASAHVLTRTGRAHVQGCARTCPHARLPRRAGGRAGGACGPRLPGAGRCSRRGWTVLPPRRLLQTPRGSPRSPFSSVPLLFPPGPQTFFLSQDSHPRCRSQRWADRLPTRTPAPICLFARPASSSLQAPHPHVDETSFPPRTCPFKSPGARRACPQGRAGGGWTAVVGGSFVSSQGPLGGRAPGKLKQRPTMAPSLPGRPRSRACTAASGGPCYFLCWLRGSWPAANGQEAGWASPPHLPGGPPRPEQPLL